MADLTVAVYVGEGYADPATSPAYVEALADVAGRLADCEVLLAETNGRITGTVTVAEPGTRSADIARPGEVEVRMLAVAPEARGRGVADDLMAEVEERARRAGARAVVLSTDPVMRAAQRLYERRGYVRTPDRDWRVDGKDLITYRLEV